MPNKITFDKEFFTKFQSNPEKVAKEYGFEEFLKDPAFSAQNFKTMNYDQFKEYATKSRFSGYFDFSAY